MFSLFGSLLLSKMCFYCAVLVVLLKKTFSATTDVNIQSEEEWK